MPDGDLRVSDAERREVADALSQHYAEGRLDEEELNERLGAAMGAKTRNDLAPLLADFPRVGVPEPRARPRRTARLFIIVIAVLLAASTARAFERPDLPWLFLGLFVLLASRRHHRHAHHVANRIGDGRDPRGRADQGAPW